MERRRPRSRRAAPFDPDAFDEPEPRDRMDAAGPEGFDGGVVEAAPTRASLDGLPIAGLSRRRAAVALGAIVVMWVIWVFVRQVGDASAATARVDRIRGENEALSAQVDALTAERELIQKQAYIEQQARAYGLGTPRERPFSLPADAPTPGPGAPGSAAARLGATDVRVSPLDAWLAVLFGADPGT